MLVQQVAMDQNISYPDDISNVSEFTVQTLIPKFSTDEEENKRKVHLGKKKKKKYITSYSLSLLTFFFTSRGIR